MANHAEIGEVADGAMVPELEVGNESSYPILLIDGETLLGARQNRIVPTSVLLGAHGRSRVPVTCVEAGRWGEERPVGHSPRLAPSAVRARNIRHVSLTAEDRVRIENDQAGVWEEVARYADRTGTSSPTMAMEDVHEHIAGRVEALVGDTKPLAHQRGVVAAIGERVVGVDLFDRSETLADYWRALTAGYAADAEDKAAKRPRRREVRRVLGEIAAGSGATVAERVHVTGQGIAATALLMDDTVVHLAATAA
jgi:hypothetical protein